MPVSHPVGRTIGLLFDVMFWGGPMTLTHSVVRPWIAALPCGPGRRVLTRAHQWIPRGRRQDTRRCRRAHVCVEWRQIQGSAWSPGCRVRCLAVAPATPTTGGGPSAASPTLCPLCGPLREPRGGPGRRPADLYWRLHPFRLALITPCCLDWHSHETQRSSCLVLTPVDLHTSPPHPK